MQKILDYILYTVLAVLILGGLCFVSWGCTYAFLRIFAMCQSMA